MGCDIHGPVIYARQDDRLVTSARRIMELGQFGRDYRLFAILANVRNDDSVTPIAEPRGFPPDGVDYFGYEASDWDGSTAKAIASGCGAPHREVLMDSCHSLSWLTTDEVVEAQKRYVHSAVLANTMLMMAILNMRTLEANGYSDVRMIFCFDS